MRLTSRMLTNLVIETSQHGLEQAKEAYTRLPLTLTRIWLELETPMCTRRLNLAQKRSNGTLSISPTIVILGEPTDLCSLRDEENKLTSLQQTTSLLEVSTSTSLRTSSTQLTAVNSPILSLCSATVLSILTSPLTLSHQSHQSSHLNPNLNQLVLKAQLESLRLLLISQLRWISKSNKMKSRKQETMVSDTG